MAWVGNSDSTGDGGGLTIFSAATDITGMSAGAMARFKVGSRAQAQDTTKNFVLTRNGGGTYAWVQQD